MNTHGPNVTKLIFEFVAVEAVPGGGGIWDGIEFFTNTEKRRAILLTAEAKVIDALRAIKSAPDNPYGDDDEKIAAALLEKIKARREAARQP